MVTAKTVVVAHGAAGFRPVFIVREEVECQTSKFAVIFFDVKDVAV
jgi:hypothetical protein